jgi:hypothetical protein
MTHTVYDTVYGVKWVRVPHPPYTPVYKANASGPYDGDMAEPGSAHLVITRNHPEDIQDRPVFLWVDGEKWDGVLRYGMTFARDVAAGHHRVKAHNTLFGHTVEFDAARDETVEFRCQNGLTGGGMLMVLMMGVAYLRVRLVRVDASTAVSTPPREARVAGSSD